MKVYRRDVVTDDMNGVWKCYEETFEQIDADSVQRHLMTNAEFSDVMLDSRVQKWFSVTDDDQLIGMSTITNDLDAVPLVSPRYFKKHHTDMYDRKAIWYIGFVGVHSRSRELHAFRSLVAEMLPQIVASDGMGVMDFSTYNVVHRHLPDITYLVLKRLNEAVQISKLDAQSFYAYRFDGKGEATT